MAALPRDLPDAPAILTPIRLDTGEAVVPRRPREGTREATEEPGFGRRRGRPAAVLVLLYPDDEDQARVLLTVRVPHLSAHAGEVSFPGGSAEEADCDPIETALREAAEEVGLEPGQCGLQVRGVLETFALTVSGFSIHPVVALAERTPSTRANPAEVDRVIHAPVEAFLPDAPVELEERVIRERLIRYGVYPVEGERVWGATARMLGQLGAALAGRDEGAGPAATSASPADAQALVRTAGAADDPAIRRFLDDLAPELARDLPPATELLVADMGGSLAGLAGWAPWDRSRTPSDERGFDGLGAVPGDHRDRAGAEVSCGGEDVGGERSARERVEDLGQRGAHALALAGGEDCDVGSCGHQAVETWVETDDTPAPGCPGPAGVGADVGAPSAQRRPVAAARFSSG